MDNKISKSTAFEKKLMPIVFVGGCFLMSAFAFYTEPFPSFHWLWGGAMAILGIFLFPYINKSIMDEVYEYEDYLTVRVNEQTYTVSFHDIVHVGNQMGSNSYFGRTSITLYLRKHEHLPKKIYFHVPRSRLETTDKNFDIKAFSKRIDTIKFHGLNT